MCSFRSLIERRLHYLRVDGLIPHHDLDCTPDARLLHRQVTQPDILVQSRRGRSAGHPSGGRAVDEDFITIAGDAAPAHLKPHELAAYAAFLLPKQGCAADEISFIELDDADQVRLERRDGGVNLMAVERHFGFQPQRVAGAETAGFYAELLARLEDFVPNSGRV